MSRHLFITAAVLALAHMTASAQAVSPDTYILRTGDAIRITVLNHPEYSTPEIEIQPDGMIMHPVAGAVVAAGRTQGAVAEDVRKAMLRELRQPRVVVTVVQYKRELVFVTGAVQRPGAHPLGEGLTVRQAVALAGGTTDTADLSRVLLISRDGSRREFGLGTADGEVGPGDDLPVEGGSTLFIYERAAQNIAVLGAVRRPGILDIPPPGLRLSDAVALVGGFTEDAAPEQGRLTRTGAPTRDVDLRKLTDDANDPANIALEHGDALLVPSRPPQTFAVMGDVRSPGVKPLGEEPLRLSAAVALGGGLTEQADAQSVMVVGRADEPVRVDMTGILRGEAPGQDRVISPGDVVFVPRLVMPQVVVLGSVRNPGRYELDAGQRVSDALARAGGLVDEPDRVEASILSADGTTRDVDLARVLARSEAEANVPLTDGDTLMVRSLDRGQVTVLGAVRSPGRYNLGQARRITDLLALAAALPHAARQASLMRPDGSVVEVDITAPGTGSAGLSLQDGDILLVESDEARVVILGEVQRPGQYVVSKSARFSDAIAAAGGLASGTRVRRASVVHRDGEQSTVELQQVLAGTDAAADIALRDGDTVLVDAAPTRQVSVLGRVRNAGKYTVEEADRVSDVLAKAGGLTADADERVATLMRADGTVMRVDLRAVLRMEDAGANLPVYPGDTLAVDPARDSFVGVMGMVNSPGYFPFKPEERIEDILARAGGPKEMADLSRSTLRRRDGATQTIDLSAVRSAEVRTLDITLQDGDSLFIPSLSIGYASALGSVRRVGRYEIGEGDRVSTLLALAGGADENAAHGELVHPDGSMTPVNLELAVAQAGSERDPVVGDGDTLVVEALRPVTVLGAVRSPGVYPLLPGTRLSAVLARAGGLLEEADTTEVTLVREGAEPRKLNLGRTLDLSDLETDITMRPGDAVLVPGISRHVAVMGAVQRPGRYPLPPGARLRDALALAGGLAVPPTRVGEATILRGAESLRVDLVRVVGAEDSSDNVTMQDGDTVLIEPQQAVRVAVLGKVSREGRYELDPGARLAHAIAQAGGIEEGADTRRVRVGRGDEAFIVDLSGLRHGDSPAGEMILQDEDIIVVPETRHTVSVLGAVRSPGVYQFEPGEAMIDVVARAGGWSEREAAPQRTLLIRRGDDAALWAPVDLMKSTATDDPVANPPLVEGDIIYVPIRSQTSDTILRALLPLTSVLRLIF